MRYILPTIIFLLALFVFASCSKKAKDTRVYGYVTEKNGTRKLGGAKVYLTKLTFGTYDTTPQYIDSTVTDAQGYYDMSHRLGEADKYVIYANTPNYFWQHDNTLGGSVGQLQSIIPGKEQDYPVELWPMAWLKIRFINTTGTYSGVDVNNVNGGGGKQIRIADVILLSGCRGNKDISINYFTQPGGVHHEKIVYCHGLDTTYVEIEY